MTCIFQQLTDGKWHCRQCGYTTKRPYERPPQKECSGAPRVPPIDYGPGTELKKIIAAYRLVPTETCGCEAMIQQMNAWGIAGCREHRAEILAHLHKAYAELNPSWADQARMGAKALAMGIIINPFDPAGSLLNAAIERARKNQPAIPPT